MDRHPARLRVPAVELRYQLLDLGLEVLVLRHALPARNAGGFRFKHHYLARELPEDARLTGSCALTALVDIDRDGDLDFVLGNGTTEIREPLQLYKNDNISRNEIGLKFLAHNFALSIRVLLYNITVQQQKQN